MMASVKRRTFLSSAVAATIQLPALAAPAGLTIVDSHIHLFDVSRPQGVPWPPKNSSIYHTALPERFRRVTAPFHVAAAIEIECSPWPADNQWVLGVAARDPIIAGTVGDLEPGTKGFREQFDALCRNALFLGLRYGNLWGRDLSEQVSHPAFISDLKLVAARGLVLDTANPDALLMHAVVRLGDSIPDLKIVVDHLPELALPADPAARKNCEADLRRLGQRPQVFAKVSGIVRNVGGRVPLDIDFYRDRLDPIWETFGPERVLYGSDWPNCDQWATYSDVFRLAHEFIAPKGPAAAEKYFGKNALRVYNCSVRGSARSPVALGAR